MHRHLTLPRRARRIGRRKYQFCSEEPTATDSRFIEEDTGFDRALICSKVLAWLVIVVGGGAKPARKLIARSPLSRGTRHTPGAWRTESSPTVGLASPPSTIARHQVAGAARGIFDVQSRHSDFAEQFGGSGRSGAAVLSMIGQPEVENDVEKKGAGITTHLLKRLAGAYRGDRSCLRTAAANG